MIAHFLRPGLLRRAVMPALLIAAVLGSGWYLASLRKADEEAQEADGQTPNFFMERFTTTSMGEDGRPTRRISADYMAHFTDTGSNEFTQPRLTLYSATGTPWEVKSERGWASSNEDVMLLLGKVHIWRDDADGERIIDIHTSDLRVLPATSYGETDQPVLISRGATESRGLGMRVYLEDDRLELLSRVRTVHDPTKRQ